MWGCGCMGITKWMGTISRSPISSRRWAQSRQDLSLFSASLPLSFLFLSHPGVTERNGGTEIPLRRFRCPSLLSRSPFPFLACLLQTLAFPDSSFLPTNSTFAVFLNFRLKQYPRILTQLKSDHVHSFLLPSERSARSCQLRPTSTVLCTQHSLIRASPKIIPVTWLTLELT